jgi:hypothetical protein
MVERLHLGMAERTVYIAESIREMEAAALPRESVVAPAAAQ